MVEHRLEKLEEKVGDIHADQSAIKQSLESMDKALSALVDLRAETVFLMKQHEKDQKEHDEIFTRLRDVEQSKSVCTAKHKVSVDDVAKLERNQRWGVITILGAVFLWALNKLTTI